MYIAPIWATAPLDTHCEQAPSMMISSSFTTACRLPDVPLGAGAALVGVQRRGVRATIGVGHDPAADLPGGQLHQLLVAGRRGDERGDARSGERHREAEIAPAELLGDEALDPDGDLGWQRRQRVAAEAKRGGLLVHLPEG